MYIPIPNGSVEVIYGYECHVPPVGYGCHSVTGEIIKTDILKRSNKDADQYWERTPLPDKYKQWQKEQEATRKKSLDEDYVHPQLQAFIEQEWNRRMVGVWFYNNGVPTYLTGLNYYYINWWQIDIGYPSYRDTDREFFYVLQNWIEDPRCGGGVDAEKRRGGKTYKGGCFITEDITRNANCEAGIQSKTATDARDVVFKKAVVSPFKKLPDFFRPVFDTSKGITPTSELKFANTTKKGSKALDDLDKPELNSVIDWASSEIFAYDGRKKRRMFQDEVGKTKDVDIYERHQVVRYCLETDGEWTGKALYSTTVEDMASGGSAFKKLWMDSDPNQRDSNGHTKTGLYRFFLPAYRTLYHDKYGFADEARAREYFMNRREAYKNDPHTLSGEIRKNPFTEAEMFRVDGEKCLYNPELLNQRLSDLEWRTNLTERGDFQWKDGKRDTQVIWVKNKNGRFEICWNFEKAGESNAVFKRGNAYYPNNKASFVIGSDPFDHDVTIDSRRSMGAAYCLRKFKSANEDSPYNNAFVCKYHGRPPMASIFYEDMLMMAVYYGCQILFENNKIGWKSYFITRGYESFLMKLKGATEYGIHANPKTKQEMAEVTEEYIETDIQKVFYKSLVQDWLEFDINNSTKFDESMAAGWTLVAAGKIKYADKPQELADINQYVRSYRA